MATWQLRDADSFAGPSRLYGYKAGRTAGCWWPDFPPSSFPIRPLSTTQPIPAPRRNLQAATIIYPKRERRPASRRRGSSASLLPLYPFPVQKKQPESWAPLPVYPGSPLARRHVPDQHTTEMRTYEHMRDARGAVDVTRCAARPWYTKLCTPRRPRKGGGARWHWGKKTRNWAGSSGSRRASYLLAQRHV